MKTIITPDHVRMVAPACKDPVLVAALLQPVLDTYAISASPERVGMFLAQWAHESNFNCLAENLSYSARRLTQVWPGRFPTLAAAKPFASNPRALANRVYNGRMGNRPGSDDGWLYRGQGWPQLTGRDNYAYYTRLTGVDLVGNPGQMMTPEISALVCGAFWQQAGCNALADQGDMVSITRKINGGQNGLDDRLARYRKVIGALRSAPKVDSAPPIPALPPKVQPPAPAPAVTRRVVLSRFGGDFEDISDARVQITGAQSVVINATDPDKVQVRVE